MLALFDRSCQLVDQWARWLAILGGLVLIGLIAVTLVSIVGRSLTILGLGPVPGDYELVEMGSAFAILAFLPWCQLRQGHVSVDLLARRFSERTNRVLMLASNVLMTLAAFILALRMTAGMTDKYGYGETTFILQIPVWWGYAGGIVGAWTFALAALVTVWWSVNDLMGRPSPLGGERLTG